MKILQLCNKVPYPPNDGGAIAIFNLASSFTENNNQVTVFAMNTVKHHADPATIPDQYKKIIDFHFFPVNTQIRLPKLICNFLFSSEPYNAVRFIDKSFIHALQKLLKEKQFDIVQLEGLYLTPYIEHIRKYSEATISYRAHNVEFEIWKRYALSISNPIKKIYFRSLANRLEKFEKNALNKYDLLIPITKNDALKLKNMGNTKPCKVIPTGIPQKNFVKVSIQENITSLFFIGSLDWIPNQEGLTWFIKRVWNEIRATQPELTFHIAGRNAPSWLIKFFSNNNVHYHGEVESAYEFYKDFHIMVVPLFAGSGMRIKIVEAMARSKVVVTTSIGAEGLGLIPNKHAIIADNASEIRKGIHNLLENKDFFTKLEKNSFEFVKTNFSNEQIGKELLKFFDQHMKK